MSKPIASTRIGIIGCGDILPNYLKGLQQFSELHLVGISDACDDIALARGQEFNVPAMSVQTLLESDASIIINLTPPAAHFAVCQQIIAANKHVYTEKPLATSFDQGQKLLAQAHAKQLRIACAPDTFLGAAGQTARELIDQGILGRVVAGTATMMERGPDDWHPNPDFFYEHGAGPLMDMGVYYLTQLVQLLGPIASVKGMAHTSWPTRIVPRGTRQGKEITVNTPTHIVAGLQFCNGAFITLTTSFDVWKHQGQHIELFGELGTMVLPDPNNFGGKIFTCHQDSDWHEVHSEKPYAINVRGLGVADLASAIHNKRAHCASAEMALHVLEVMEKVLLACEDGKAQNIATRCARPELLQMQA